MLFQPCVNANTCGVKAFHALKEYICLKTLILNSCRKIFVTYCVVFHDVFRD
jgi:hypothetical protein